VHVDVYIGLKELSIGPLWFNPHLSHDPQYPATSYNTPFLISGPSPFTNTAFIPPPNKPILNPSTYFYGRVYTMQINPSTFPAASDLFTSH
jgi:hypothetical protein